MRVWDVSNRPPSRPPIRDRRTTAPYSAPPMYDSARDSASPGTPITTYSGIAVAMFTTFVTTFTIQGVFVSCIA